MADFPLHHGFTTSDVRASPKSFTSSILARFKCPHTRGGTKFPPRHCQRSSVSSRRADDASVLLATRSRSSEQGGALTRGRLARDKPSGSAKWQTPRLEDYAVRCRRRGTRPSRARIRHLGHTKNDPLDLQHKYRTAAPKLSKAMPEHASTPALVVQAARPPQLLRQRPMLRLPNEHYKIVIRPRHPINLSNIGLATLMEAIQNSTKVDPDRAEGEDQIRNNIFKNTCTVSTPDRFRADAYRSLEVLRSQR
ncbi:hypothetical protein HPB51_002959 [Rhipicephalus microplus]|uniref:Uncharacterized protein n=1 Tax=Rhipicephalus microplus TaxID=6941 RepID=A0A9J6DS84_RHIMP|nr:hypothetical protein HPB51_002959 [Rhipicephalus microplus]